MSPLRGSTEHETGHETEGSLDPAVLISWLFLILSPISITLHQQLLGILKSYPGSISLPFLGVGLGGILLAKQLLNFFVLPEYLQLIFLPHNTLSPLQLAGYPTLNSQYLDQETV